MPCLKEQLPPLESNLFLIPLDVEQKTFDFTQPSPHHKHDEIIQNKNFYASLRNFCSLHEASISSFTAFGKFCAVVFRNDRLT